MAITKSIGRTLAQIDVAATTSVRIHEDFFNSHRDYHHQSHFEIDREAELPVTTEQAHTEAACSRYGTRVL
jgi:hypothetical protein